MVRRFLGCALVIGIAACSNDYDAFSFTDDAGTAGGGGVGNTGGTAGTGTGGLAGSASGGVGNTGGTAGTGTGGTAGTGTGGTAGTGTGGTAGTGTGGTAGTGTGGTAGTGTGGTAGTGTGGTAGAAGATGNQPGVVGCSGSNDCSLSSSFCCITFQNKTCQNKNQPCTPGTDVLCDGPEDCTGGDVCCGQLGGGGSYYSILECRPANECNQNQGRRIICGTTPSVCPGNTTCQQSSILTQYNFCGN